MQIRRPHHRLWCSTFVLKVSRMRIFARRGFDASTSARAQHEERAKGACIKTPPRGVSRSPRRHREARSSPRGHPSLFSPTTRRHFASHALVERLLFNVADQISLERWTRDRLRRWTGFTRRSTSQRLAPSPFDRLTTALRFTKSATRTATRADERAPPEFRQWHPLPR